MSTFKQFLMLVVFGLAVTSCKKNDGQDAPPATTDYHQNAVTKFITADGVKYAYRELGEKEGIPIVMLSSLGSNMDDWDPAITNGLAQRYKVILFDNEGVGLSSGQTPTSIAAMSQGAVRFVKAMGWQKVNLLGFSMGSFIAQEMALTESSLVNRIVLTGTGPKGAIGLSNLPGLIGSIADLSEEEGFLQLGFTSSEESIRKGKLSFERAHKRTENRDKSLSDESVGAQVQAVLDWAQPNPNALDELKSLEQPVLIAQGKEDKPVPVENSIDMSKNLPHCQLILYTDAGHAAIYQYADEFLPKAIDFFAKGDN